MLAWSKAKPETARGELWLRKGDPKRMITLSFPLHWLEMETHPDGKSTSESGKTKGYPEGTKGCMFLRIWNKTPNFGLQNPKLKDGLVHLF